MDLNLVVMCGRVVSEPELREFEGGSCLLRLLVTVRSDHPRRRIDVLPVTWWDPPVEYRTGWTVGVRVWIVGSIQRRFWEGPDGRRSRIEAIAQVVSLHPVLEEAPAA